MSRDRSPHNAVVDWNTFRFEFRDDQLWLEGRDGWREAICPVCNEPIRWCLDMFTFSTGYPYILCHARCSWQPDAFDRQRKLAELDAERTSAWWEARSHDRRP
jgi:hypothetical protein